MKSVRQLLHANGGVFIAESNERLQILVGEVGARCVKGECENKC